MLSTVAGICLPQTQETKVIHAVSGLIDFAGFVTMLVLGILAIHGSLAMGSTGGWLLLAGGGIGLVLLAIKNGKTCPSAPFHA